MKIAILVLVVVAILATVACSGGETGPTAAPMDSEPTPDVQSAVEAGIAATREADKSIEPTITARVEATKAAEPTPEPTPTLPPPTPTMQLDPTVAPTPTRIPQSMPIAAPASEEIRGFAGRLYDCIKENWEFRQMYEQGAVFGGTAEGMTEEGASELVEFRLSSKEFFVLAYTEGVTEDSSIEALLRVCEGTASGQVQSGGPIDVLSGKLYDCMLRNDEFREIFRQAGTSSAAEEGLTHEAAIGLVDYLLNSRDFFILSARITARDNPLFAADLEASLVECESSADAAQPSDTSLRDYADRHAGGPGAIYVGDLNQLAGPAVANEFLSAYGADLGDDYGDVPLDAIRDHRWIFESDYYQSLLEKAKLTNPTNLVSRGERITLKHACINRTLPWCKHMEAYFVPNVIARTNGQVRIETTSFPELGLAGFDTADLLREGTLGMSEVYGGYVGGQFPTLAVQNLWGLWPDHETHFAVQVSLAPEVNRVIAIEMDAQVLMRNWIAGDDQLLFSNHRLDSPGDFRGLKTRSHSTELSDWINGMGANAQAMAFAEVYTALERGILEAGVTGANAGLSQRWYEVINYINGPLYSFNSTINAINGDVWDSIPWDLQQILLEEGAKYELEALRLSAIQNLTGLQRNIEAGLVFVEFNAEVRQRGFQSASESVVPNWVKRLDYPDYDDGTVAAFNNNVGPYVGLRIERDGSVVKVPITKGPHAGRTIEQVLSE